MDRETKLWMFGTMSVLSSAGFAYFLDRQMNKSKSKSKEENLANDVKQGQEKVEKVNDQMKNLVTTTNAVDKVDSLIGENVRAISDSSATSEQVAQNIIAIASTRSDRKAKAKLREEALRKLGQLILVPNLGKELKTLDDEFDTTLGEIDVRNPLLGRQMIQDVFPHKAEKRRIAKKKIEDEIMEKTRQLLDKLGKKQLELLNVQALYLILKIGERCSRKNCSDLDKREIESMQNAQKNSKNPLIPIGDRVENMSKAMNKLKAHFVRFYAESTDPEIYDCTSETLENGIKVMKCNT